MAAPPKYPLPQFLAGTTSQDNYDKWLSARARTLFYLVADFGDSLIPLPLMFKPAGHMATLWRPVRIMDDAAFFVPFVFAEKLNQIPFLKIADTGRDIDVVRNQECLTGGQHDDESLVPGAAFVIRQNTGDYALSRYLQIAFMVRKRHGED